MKERTVIEPFKKESKQNEREKGAEETFHRYFRYKFKSQRDVQLSIDLAKVFKAINCDAWTTRHQILKSKKQ